MSKTIEETFPMNRRQFLKATAITGTALAIATTAREEILGADRPEHVQALEDEEVCYTNVTNNGIHYTFVKDGRITRSDSISLPTDVQYPRFEVDGKVFEPPFKSINGPVAIGYREYTYAPDRTRYPLKRVGFTPGGGSDVSNRGAGEFVRITWDEALDMVASEIQRIKATYGPGAIMEYSGSNSERTEFEGKDNHERLLNILGGTTSVREPTYSEPGWAYGGPFIWGFTWKKGGGDDDDIVVDTVLNSEMVVFWGTNPMITSAINAGPDAAHLYSYLKEIGKKIVVVDPYYNETAGKFADTFISPIPGTDCAMMAAIAHVWIEENLYDKEYVRTHTLGFDEDLAARRAA
jgi:trimethylamine-N-oxide reductase (cytochrome c)